MKKIFVMLAAVAMTAVSVAAQDGTAGTTLAQVTEAYNNAAIAINDGNKEAALTGFQTALSMAETLGEQGLEVATNCKNMIPQLLLSIGKDLIKAENYDGAIEKLNTTIAKAEEYANADVVSEAKALIPQIFMSKAGDLLNSKDFAGAVEAYGKVLELNPTNGMAALRQGMALGALGKVEEAETAYKTAIENGQEKSALKQLANLFVKQAAADLKTKNYAGALEDAVKSLGYLDTPTAAKIAGTAASKLGKNAETIEFFEKYLALSPNAKDATQMKYQIADAAEKLGNKAKAKEFYQMIVNDPNFGEYAKSKISIL